MPNYEDDLDLLTDEEKREREEKYQLDYHQKFNELSARRGFNEEERSNLLGEMIASGHRFNSRHSTSGALDAELNARRFFEAKRHDEHREFDDSSQGLLDHISKADGKSLRETKEWARQALKEVPPAWLDEDL